MLFPPNQSSSSQSPPPSSLAISCAHRLPPNLRPLQPQIPPTPRRPVALAASDRAGGRRASESRRLLLSGSRLSPFRLALSQLAGRCRLVPSAAAATSSPLATTHPAEQSKSATETSNPAPSHAPLTPARRRRFSSAVLQEAPAGGSVRRVAGSPGGGSVIPFPPSPLRAATTSPAPKEAPPAGMQDEAIAASNPCAARCFVVAPTTEMRDEAAVTEEATLEELS